MSAAATISRASDDWHTPRAVLDLAVEVAGPIMFDPFPCNWDGTLDGFAVGWASSHTFLNPPYSRMADFAEKFAIETADALTPLIALIPCRPDTRWWDVMRLHASAVCFWRGRIKFGRANGKPATSAPFPSALFYAGPTPGRFADVLSSHGWVVAL